MAHEILGTFNLAQFTRFAAFARSQLALVDGRVQHLKAEIDRIGLLVFQYDKGGVPIGYAVDPPEAYIGRLMAAYEVLGGDAFYDLNVRALTQPVFILKGSETVNPQMMSNGEIIPAGALADAPSAVLMQRARGWIDDALMYRRDYLERKIRRMVDYADQLGAELAVLQAIQGTSSTAGSLEEIFKEIQELIADKSYRAISADTDPFGKKTYAPFAAYMPGPKGAPAGGYERTFDGPVEPGAVGTAADSGKKA